MATVDVTLPPAGATPPTEGTPPPEGTSPPAGDGNEELSIEQAQALIEQLRTENSTLTTDRDRWKSTSRKNERELTKARGAAGTPPAEGAGGQPAATSTGGVDPEVRALRLEVALDLGLPKALAVRLQGDDEDSIREDAEALLKLVPKTPRVPGSADGGGGAPPPMAAKSFGDKIREAAGIKPVTFP